MTLTQDQLLDHFENNFHIDTAGLEPDTLLFSSGLVDSFNMIDLIVFIEESCGIKFKPSDINLDNIDSISRILTFLERRQD